VTVDANGWPLGGHPIGGPPDAAHNPAAVRTFLAAWDLVRIRAERAAEAKAKKASDAKRTKKSTETIKARAAEHFSGKWLAAAHEANPEMGAYRLAATARGLLFAHKDDPDNERRREISEHRAKEYLKTRKKLGDT
jgi:leucyl aminopeptidase (aminopeptidase T)